MSDSSPTPKKRGRPPKIKEVETNSATPPSYENNSYATYQGSYQDVTTNLFGSNFFSSYSTESIESMVANPMNTNREVRHMAKLIYNSNGIVTNVVDYMVAMPTLDKIIIPHGTSKPKIKKNKEKMEWALKTIKDKEFIRDCIFRDANEGICFYYCETTKPINDKDNTLSDYDIQRITEINSLDDSGMNISMISLSADYCKIVGIKNSSYVIAFNLDYFSDYVGDSLERKLKKYPKEIRDGYTTKNTQSNSNNWLILDNTKTIVHKIRSSKDEPWGRPLVLAALKNILYSDYFTETKRNVLDELNNKVIYETFPEGEKKGMSSLTEKQQKNQHETVKTAVMQKNSRGGTSFFSVAAGTKLDSLDVQTAIFDEKNEKDLTDKIATDLGFAASLLNGSSSGNYSTQQNNLQLVISEVFSWIEGISSELNKVINANVIQDKVNYMEVYYLPCSLVNRKEFFGYMKDLYSSAKGSLSALIASTGVNVDAYMAMLDYETEENWENRYPIHATSFTMSGKDSADSDKDKSGGAPTVDNPTNQQTIQTKSNNGNKQPKPSTK